MPRELLLPPAYRERVEASMRALADEVGLVMKTRGRLINSRLALATAEFARERGRFDEVHRALFRMHWEGTGELDRVADLQRVAAAAGLDPEELAVALREGRYEPAIDGHRRDAESVGIDAIPAHVLGRRYLLVGAQPYEDFRRALERLAART